MSHRDDVGMRVLALGDSVSYGVGDIGPDCVGAGWVRRFAHLVDADDVRNVSHTGARARHLAPQLARRDGFRPDVVLVCIGGNDVLRWDFKPNAIERDVTAAVRRLREEGARVVIMGLPNPERTAPTSPIIRGVLAERAVHLQRALVAAAAQGGAEFLDLWDDESVLDRRYWHIDRFHPSPVGHEALARRSASVLGIPVSRDGLPTSSPTHAREQRKWFVRAVLRWLAKRSIDLLPAIAFLVGRAIVRRYRLGLSQTLAIGGSTSLAEAGRP